MSSANPRVRRQGIRVEEFQGEVLVYDLDRHTAHCLNGAAVAVWELADGSRAVDEIAAAIAERTSATADEGVVWRALEELEKAALLETPLVNDPVNLSRRRMFGLGWAAAVPLVLSISVPTPAFAQTIGPTAT